MEIRRDILLRHLAQAAIEQLSTDYALKGYEVVIGPEVDKGVDLLVRKGRDIIGFDLKVGEWNSHQRQEAREVRNRLVHELGAKYKLVLVNAPDEPDIVVDELESLFLELLPEHFVDQFSQLATHYWIDEITDFIFEKLWIRPADIEAQGVGTVTLGLQYGSDSDFDRGDGTRFSEAFPFYFHILLDRDIKVKELYELELDAPEDIE